MRSDLEVARSYGFKGKAPVTMEVDPHQACGYLESDEWNDEGLDERAERLATIIRQLPWAPFNTPAFQALSCRPLEGLRWRRAVPGRRKTRRGCGTIGA